jgi:hypothetical protein
VGTEVPVVVVVMGRSQKNADQNLDMEPPPGYHACATAVPWDGTLYDEFRAVVDLSKTSSGNVLE